MIESKAERDTKIGSVFDAIRKAGCDIEDPKPLDRKLGDNAICFTATYRGEKVFVKSNPTWAQHAADIVGMRTLRKAGLPVPQVIFHNGFKEDEKPLFLVQTFIEGTPLVEESEANQIELLKEAGALLRKIHSIPVEGYGKWDFSGTGLRGEKQTWEEGMRDPGLMQLRDRGEIDLEEYTVLESIFNTLKKRQVQKPVLLYSDYHPDHIFVKDGKITGIIDPGNSRAGDYMYDVAYTCYYLDSQKKSAFLEGYASEIDPELLLQYESLIAARKLNYRISVKKEEGIEKSRKNSAIS